MGDRQDADLKTDFQADFQADLSSGLSDPLPGSCGMALERSAALQSADAVLLEALEPVHLRAVAQWLRAIARTDHHPAPRDVGDSFRAQANCLEQLARRTQTAEDAIVGTLMSATLAYWMTAAGQYWSQALGQVPGEEDAPAERCLEATFRQAYLNPDFTVLLGAERLAQCFGERGHGGDS